MARQLIALGFDAAALEGGYNAWRAAYPAEPKTADLVAIPRAVAPRANSAISESALLEALLSGHNDGHE